MKRQICLFHDYLGTISNREKVGMVSEYGAKVIDHPYSHREIESKKDEFYNIRNEYKRTVIELKDIFGRFAPNALSALVQAKGASNISATLSKDSNKFISYLVEHWAGKPKNISNWALNPINWVYLSSKQSSFELQSNISSFFPCVVFDDGPLECSGNEPEVKLENIEDILSATGIYNVWQSGILGEKSRVVVLDTGVSKTISNNFGIKQKSISGLDSTDYDGHGTAVAQIIRSLAPKASIESCKILKSYSDGNIWNLVLGLTQYFNVSNLVINLSLGVTPGFVASLGSSAKSFQESIINIVSAISSQNSFLICAAGNDSSSSLRWPAAAPEALAVGSYNSAFNLSAFSNYSKDACNYVIAPGGDIRSTDQKVDGFGKYGKDLTRDLFGTSFSCAIASGISALLSEFGWFREMATASKLSLFHNHCTKNSEGYPILNLNDIGAVWPLKKSKGRGLPVELLRLLTSR